jgi:hypothetical protein
MWRIIGKWTRTHLHTKKMVHPTTGRQNILHSGHFHNSYMYLFIFTCFYLYPLKYSFFLGGWERLGFELRVSHLKSRLSQRRCSTAWVTTLVHFTLGVLEMGSQEQFARLASHQTSFLQISTTYVSRITSACHQSLAKPVINGLNRQCPSLAHVFPS